MSGWESRKLTRNREDFISMCLGRYVWKPYSNKKQNWAIITSFGYSFPFFWSTCLLCHCPVRLSIDCLKSFRFFRRLNRGTESTFLLCCFIGAFRAQNRWIPIISNNYSHDFYSIWLLFAKFWYLYLTGFQLLMCFFILISDVLQNQTLCFVVKELQLLQRQTWVNRSLTFQWFSICWVLYVPGMVLDGVVTKIKQALPYSDMYKTKWEQDWSDCGIPGWFLELGREACGSAAV